MSADPVSDYEEERFVIHEVKRKFPWWYPPRQVFSLASKFRGFKVGCMRVYSGNMCLVLLLNGPWIQRFRKDHGKPGQLWNPRRWGGAFIGLEIGCRG